MGSRHSKTLFSLALAASSLAAMGCGCSRAGYTPRAAEHAATRRAPVDPQRVDVLLDGPPARPYRVVGELRARRIESPASIVAMQRRAASEGLDGIYWIDCSKGTRVCTAKGFVYDKETPPMPEINAHAAAPTDLTKGEPVAHR